MKSVWFRINKYQANVVVGIVLIYTSAGSFGLGAPLNPSVRTVKLSFFFLAGFASSVLKLCYGVHLRYDDDVFLPHRSRSLLSRGERLLRITV